MVACVGSDFLNVGYRGGLDGDKSVTLGDKQVHPCQLAEVAALQ